MSEEPKRQLPPIPTYSKPIPKAQPKRTREEWAAEAKRLAEALRDDWDGSPRDQDACIVLWMCWVSRDPVEISRLTGLAEHKVREYVKRAETGGVALPNLRMDAEAWFEPAPSPVPEGRTPEEHKALSSQLAFFLDVLVVSGQMLRGRDEQGQLVYKHNEDSPLSVDDLVRSKSGFGATLEVASVSEDGTQIRLRRLGTNSSGAKFRSAGDFKRVGHKNSASPATHH